MADKVTITVHMETFGAVEVSAEADNLSQQLDKLESTINSLADAALAQAARTVDADKATGGDDADRD